MEIIDNVSDLRIAAIQNRPAFEVAYSQAPAAVRFRGQTVYRDAATSAESKLAFLAAVALTQPEALSPVANANTFGLEGLDGTSYGVDADRSDLDAAVKTQRAAESKLKKLETRNKQLPTEILRAKGILAECAIVDGTDIGLAILTLGIGTGIKHTVCESDAKAALKKLTDEQEKTANGIQDTKNEIQDAALAVKEAQDAYDKENQRLRAEEEAARLEKLKKDLEDAKKRQDEAEQEAKIAAAEAAAKAAKDRADNAANAAAAQAQQTADDAAYCAQYPDDCYDPSQGDGYTDEYGNQWANPDQGFLDREQGADVYGSEEQASDLGASPDSDYTESYSSPWEFDRYYACDCAGGGEDEGEYACDACDATYGLDSYGADTSNIVGGIVAGVLVMAPSIIEAFSGGDSKGKGGNSKLGDAGEQGQEQGEVADPYMDALLAKTGLKKQLTDASKKSGAEAGAKISQTIYIVAGVALVGGVVYFATRKG